MRLTLCLWSLQDTGANQSIKNEAGLLAMSSQLHPRDRMLGFAQKPIKCGYCSSVFLTWDFLGLDRGAEEWLVSLEAGTFILVEEVMEKMRSL